jgi:hypothetical protein
MTCLTNGVLEHNSFVSWGPSVYKWRVLITYIKYKCDVLYVLYLWASIYKYMVTTTPLARYSNAAFLSRNMILTAVCNECLGGNNCRSPPRTFLATTLTMYSFCLNNYRNYWTMYHWQCSTQCGYCKKGAPAHSSHDAIQYIHGHREGQWLVVWPLQHPVLLLPTSTRGAIWGAMFMLKDVICRMNCGMPQKWLEWQYERNCDQFTVLCANTCPFIKFKILKSS